MSLREIDGEVRPLNEARCVGYTRVSSGQQATEDRTSLAEQRRAIEAKATALGLQVGAWFEDAGFSGTSVERRPDFRSMIASCREQPRPAKVPGIILALNDSRFARFPDPGDSIYYQQGLKRLGWIVRFCEGDDVEDSLARGLLRYVGAASAGDYSIKLAARTAEGKRGAAQKGFWTGKATLGYLRMVCWPPGRAERVLADGEHKGKDEHVRLVPNPDGSADFIRELFERYASGRDSTRSLAEWANQRYPGRWWDSPTVSDYLKRRTYLGEIHYRGGVVEEAHSALVSRELFDRVQRRLRSSPHATRSKKHTYLLTNVVRCERCGYFLIGNGSSKGHRYYKCKGQKLPGTPCSHGGASSIRVVELETWMRDVIAAELARPEFQHAVFRAIDRIAAQSESSSPQPRTDSLEAAIARLTREREAVKGLRRREAISEDEAVRDIRDIDVQIADCDAQRRQVLRLADHRMRRGIDRDALYQRVRETPDRLRDVDSFRAQQAVRLWVASASIEPSTKRVRVAIRPPIGELWNGGLWGPETGESTTAPIPVVIREVAFGRRRK